jgi:phosphoglycolate phosphatase
VNPKTLIFDLDGTISDPFAGISRSINFALESHDYEPVDPELIRPMIGPPLTDIFAHLVGEITEPRMQALIDKYRERYASIGYTENVIYDGMPAIIGALTSSGFILGVCTSKRIDYASDILDMFGLSAHFRFISGGDVGIHKTEQIEKLVADGLDANSAVMIGDRHFDIVAARNCGLTAVGVSWGFGDNEELDSAAPDHIVHSPEELLELFV